MAKRDRFFGCILYQPVADGVIEFIHSLKVVGGFARSAPFQDDHRERRSGAEFLGQQQSAPTAANDDHICPAKCPHRESSQGLTSCPTASRRLIGLGRYG